MAATQSPIFPMLEPHHFSDYGFDPQLDFFQVLGEARRQKREASASSRAIDSLHFKLQKPISKDDHNPFSSRRLPFKNRKWWRNALHFLRPRWPMPKSRRSKPNHHHRGGEQPFHVSTPFRASISGPIYFTESRNECRRTNGPSSGPLAGTLTPSREGDLGIPYLSLRELNMDAQQHSHSHRMSTSAAMPIYLVT